MTVDEIQKMRDALVQIANFASKTKPEDWSQIESKNEWCYRENEDITIISKCQPMFLRPTVRFKGRGIHINDLTSEHRLLLESLWKNLEIMADDERCRKNIEKTVELYHTAVEFVKTIEENGLLA